MKQILLVDDDFLALNTFYSLVDWAQLDLSIAFEAHGGREALAYLEGCEQLPSVAYIDVCMPDMDGITLLQMLRAQYPSIVCFMLSSHSDYPYVRETLKLGAADYMLKHEISPESILSALREHGLIQPDLSSSLSPDERLLHTLQGQAQAQLSGFLLYAVYRDTRPLLEVQRKSILQTCRHLLNATLGAVVCAPTDESIAILLPAQENPDGAAAAIQVITSLQKALMKYHNARYVFSPPRFCENGRNLTETYAQLIQQSDSACAAHQQAGKVDLSQLTLALASGSRQRVAQALQELLRAEGMDAAELNNQLLVFLAQTRQSMGLSPATLDTMLTDGAYALFLQQFSLLCEENTRRIHTAFSPSIREALSFVEAHYAEDIQLSDVARHCHLSYTHLSYLFKKETGNNLIRYLTRVRVYHAAHMLLFNGLSVSEACQQSGFKSYNHFVTTFKTITGMTPSEFRKSPTAADWLLSFHSRPQMI